MGNRSLLEINHDNYSHVIENDPRGFAAAVREYLRSNSPQNAMALGRFGIRVIRTRHHSDWFSIDYGGHYASEGKRK